MRYLHQPESFQSVIQCASNISEHTNLPSQVGVDFSWGSGLHCKMFDLLWPPKIVFIFPKAHGTLEDSRGTVQRDVDICS